MTRNECHQLFHKTSHNHVLGHIISYIPFELAIHLVLVSKSFYKVIYSPHTRFSLKELNKYPHYIPRNLFSISYETHKRKSTLIRSKNKRKSHKTFTSHRSRNHVRSGDILSETSKNNSIYSENHQKSDDGSEKQVNECHMIRDEQNNPVNDESQEINNSQSKRSLKRAKLNTKSKHVLQSESRKSSSSNASLSIIKHSPQKSKRVPSKPLSSKILAERKKRWRNSLSNVALVKYYFSSLEIFRVDEEHPTLERRVFRCFLRRSNHFLRELSLFRCRIKTNTLCRILKECIVLETLELRFIEWISSGTSKSDRRKKKLKNRMDLSTSIEGEQLLQALEEPIHTQPLKLLFHEELKLQLKTLEIRNENTVQVEPFLIKVIAQCCESVTSLTLARFLEEQLREMFESVPTSNPVGRVHLAWIDGIRVETLDTLASRCLSLKHLKISHSTYEGYVPSYSNDFSKFYSLMSLNTILCDSQQLTETILSMLPRSEMRMSHFQSIAYQTVSEKRVPYDDIQLRHLCCFNFDRSVELFLLRNQSYLTHVNITESRLTEQQIRSLLSCKYIIDLKLKTDDSISLIQLLGILSKYSIRSNLEGLTAYIAYPKVNHSEYLVDLESQTFEALETLEIHGQFHVLPLCFCPQLKRLIIHDLYFDDAHSLFSVVGQYNPELIYMELFSSSIIPSERSVASRAEKIPLVPNFTLKTIRIMETSAPLQLYDVLRLMMHFPLASFNPLKMQIKFSKRLCDPFVKHPMLTHPLDAFKALILWSLDQIFSLEYQYLQDSAEYMSSLIRIIDSYDTNDDSFYELPLLPILFNVFKESFTFVPELPLFSPPRALARIVVTEKYRQFIKKVKRKEEGILQFLSEYTI